MEIPVQNYGESGEQMRQRRSKKPIAVPRSGLSLQLSIYVMFFLSGATALIFEILWSRQFVTVFGNSSYAISVVLCAFMGGLGIGSLIGGRLADRFPQRLLMYGVMQAGVALWAMGIPALLEFILVYLPGLSLLAPQSLLVPSLTRFVVSFGVLLVPCTMMGATLPLLSRFCADSVHVIGRRIGMLYGLNTLGAAAGCFLAGFWMIQTLGLSATNWLAIAVNLFITMFVLLHHFARSRGAAPVLRQSKQTAAARPAGQGESEPSRKVRRLLLAVAFLAGMAGLSCEVLWVRYMGFFGNDPYVFTMILGTYLLGLGAGSLFYRSLLSGFTRPLNILAWVVLLLGLSVPSFFGASTLILSLSEPGTVKSVLLMLVIAVVPALLMGMTFPLLCSAFTGSVARVGRSVGTLYAVNTIGSIVGSIIPVFVLIPAMGIQQSILLMGLLYVGMAWALLVVAARRRKGLQLAWLATCSALMVIVFTIIVPGDLCKKSFLASSNKLGRHNDIIFYREGRTGTAVVVRDKVNGLKSIYINGTLEVPTRYVDMACFKLLGGLGPLLHPNPEEVAMICFGGGIAAGAAVLYPDVKSLEVVDLESSVVEAARLFKQENNDLLCNPKLQVAVDDGRNYILVSKKKWPVIITDSTHPKSSDSWVLYTQEFYELLKAHLTKDGVLVQWLPTHGLTVAEYQIILRTFQSVFPHASLWISHGIAEMDGYIRYTMMVATPQKLDIDVESLKNKLSAPAVAADMGPWHLDDPVGVLESFVCGEETLRRWTGDGDVNTDNLPYTQYETKYSKRSPKLEGDSIAPLVESIWPYLRNTGGEHESQLLERKLDLHSKANRLMFMGKFRDAYSLLPEDGKVRKYRENRNLNAQYLSQVADFYRDSPDVLHRTGLELSNMGRLDEAIALFQRATAIKPDFAEAHCNLGVALANQGRLDEAIGHFQRAIAIKPDFAEAQRNLGVALRSRAESMRQ
jgi:spermidine synthase